MTPKEFNQALKAANMSPDSRTAKALRKCLVEGATAYRAARDVGVHPSAVIVGKARISAVLKAGICPTCGQVRR